MLFDESLKAKLLPATLIVRNFVKGDDNCNYEIYLREFLNHSSWFRKKVLYDFVAPLSEANNECDAYAGEYGIDFKLIGSRTALQARSILSKTITNLSNGVTAYGVSKDNTFMSVFRIHAILRNRTIEDLKAIREIETRAQNEETEIRTFLKTLETQKNLLLFFPYEFSFETTYEILEGANQIENALNMDFRNSILYRYERTENLETYMSFIYEDYFFIMFWDDDRFKIIDHIELSKSKTYMRLKNYSIWL